MLGHTCTMNQRRDGTGQTEEIWIEHQVILMMALLWRCGFLTNAFSNKKSHARRFYSLDEWLGTSHIGVHACLSPWFASNGFCMSFWLFFSLFIIVHYCFFFIPSYLLFVVVGFVVVPLSAFGFACENYQLAQFGRRFNIHIQFGTSHTSAVWLRYCSDIGVCVLFFIMLRIRRGREFKSNEKKP